VGAGKAKPSPGGGRGNNQLRMAYRQGDHLQIASGTVLLSGADEHSRSVRVGARARANSDNAGPRDDTTPCVGANEQSSVRLAAADLKATARRRSAAFFTESRYRVERAVEDGPPTASPALLLFPRIRSRARAPIEAGGLMETVPIASVAPSESRCAFVREAGSESADTVRLDAFAGGWFADALIRRLLEH
jgi:hypothetical protein